MMKWMRLLCYILLICLPAGLIQAASQLQVKYLSAEHVYLSGGGADGLVVGARLAVLGAKGAKAELEVVFVSEHSASCTVIGDVSAVQIGDKVELTAVPVRDSSLVVPSDTFTTAAQPKPVEALPTSFERSTTKTIRKIAPLNGSISAIFYQWNDNSEANLDFTQFTTRLSMKARRLWGREITLAVRGRGRFDKRIREYRPDVARDEWENKLWEFSLSYEESASPVNLYAGRILPRGAGGAGYLDGALLELKASKKFHVSAFGGAAPEFFYDDQALSLMKYGGYLSFLTGDYRHTLFEQSLGVTMEYHGSEVNREYIFLQGRLSQSSNWGLNHSAEIDLNTGWRKEKVGSATTLSNIYLNWWLRPSTWYRLSLSYDNRTNYWTFANRSTIDSLFDQNLRQGIRIQNELNLPSRITPSFSISYRSVEGETDPTWSYSFLLRKGDAFIKNATVVLQYASFDGPGTSGHNSALRANVQATSNVGLGLGYSNYAYTTSATTDQRTNQAVEMNSHFNFGRRYWMGTMLQSNTGDDSRGFRVQTELGLRF